MAFLEDLITYLSTSELQRITIPEKNLASFNGYIFHMYVICIKIGSLVLVLFKKMAPDFHLRRLHSSIDVQQLAVK